MLLAGGVVLVVIGLAIVFRDEPESIGYRVDGLTNGMPLPELEEPSADVNLRLVAGGVVAIGGVVAAMIGAVATGVWLAGDRGGDRG
ncbi:hypothetical protein NOCA1130300 [metagenome]|uniref:Uncharacterized protein n=1 Tax=metagenome TaxID=256318 RepID=A0A2P2C7F1_9ZZZZ